MSGPIIFVPKIPQQMLNPNRCLYLDDLFTLRLCCAQQGVFAPVENTVIGNHTLIQPDHFRSKTFQITSEKKSKTFDFFQISPEENDISRISQHLFADPLIAQLFAYFTNCITLAVTKIPMLFILIVGTLHIVYFFQEKISLNFTNGQKIRWKIINYLSELLQKI